ncbi:hypothetical protein [Microbacterium sp. NPDC087665]|uniref:hypothetical protein n=1 Tax=Microbacterium sp. NPDC087665 TaxID=3364194 RepID=UPI00382B3012
MFELYNRPFLQEIVDKRLPVKFSENPDKDEGYLHDEYLFLGEKGYVFHEDTLTMTPPKG